MNLSGNCVADIQYAFSTPSQQLSPYYDASGKVSAGVLEGATSWLGNYEQCQSLLQARYCLLSLLSSSHKQDEFKWGLCAVSSCNNTAIEDNFQQIINIGLPNNGYNFENVTAHCVEEVPVQTGFYGTIGLILSLAVICILGSFAEWWYRYRVRHHPRLVHRISSRGPHMVPDTPDGGMGAGLIQEEEEEWDRPPLITTIHNAIKPGWLTLLLTCFSLEHNMRKLAGGAGAGTGGYLACVDGVRVLAMLWVVAAHTYLTVFLSQNIVNPRDAEWYNQQLLWQPIGNAHLAADTFFFLSGLLVCYRGLARMRKQNGKIGILSFYLRRYYRLTPLVGFTLLVWVYVLPQVGSGPLWYSVQADGGKCNWWAPLLYIQNFFPYDSQCMSWLWYLALDMQFYLIAPIIIWLLYRSPKQGLCLIGCLVIVSVIITATLIVTYDLDVNLTSSIIRMDTAGALRYWEMIHSKPYCRAAPYLLGMALGSVLHATARSEGINTITVFMVWAVSLATGAVVMLGPWLSPSLSPGGALTSLGAHAAYGALGHAAWGLAIAPMLYLCCQGYAGHVGSVLGWGGWQVLGRLTYGVFLLHPVVLIAMVFSATVPIYASTLTMGLYVSCTVVLSFLLSGALSLLLYMPLINLKDLVIGAPPTPGSL